MNEWFNRGLSLSWLRGSLGADQGADRRWWHPHQLRWPLAQMWIRWQRSDLVESGANLTAADRLAAPLDMPWLISLSTTATTGVIIRNPGIETDVNFNHLCNEGISSDIRTRGRLRSGSDLPLIMPVATTTTTSTTGSNISDSSALLAQLLTGTATPGTASTTLVLTADPTTPR